MSPESRHRGPVERLLDAVCPGRPGWCRHPWDLPLPAPGEAFTTDLPADYLAILRHRMEAEGP